MNLTALLADIYRRTGFVAAPASEVTTRLTAYINETQQEILSKPGMEWLFNGALTFDSVASTPQYALPQAVSRVKSIRETTNDRRLESRSFDWYRSAYPDSTAVTGTPFAFVDMGLSNIAVQPSNASAVFVDSTSAGDTGTAYVEGFTTGGYYRTASVTITGTTAVQVGTITDWVFLTKFHVSFADGTVTLHEDASGGTELARIPAGLIHTAAHYRLIALVPTPSSVTTYTVDFAWDVQPLVVGTDEPIIPFRFHRLLAIGARMKEYERREQMARWRAAKSEYDKGMSELKYFVYSQSVGTPNLRGHYQTAADIIRQRLTAW